FAEFTHTYGKLGLKATKEERVYLARLYWMTIEFGLVDQGHDVLVGQLEQALQLRQHEVQGLQDIDPVRRA
ncbi:phenylalanine 4-monooxygenase, partial [Pseudomonas otitidis]|nr:phenylalanine 4-monooxygenase [Pseudomonas otitidis]